MAKLIGRDRATERMGAYTLLEKLGHGGMGEVWRAKHRDLLRPAAIKLMTPGLHSPLESNDVMRKRFDQEVQATALLTSPHTVAVYDFGKTDDGALYYVMELLDGLDMELLVTKFGPQPADRVANLLGQVCESLDEAHHRGLVHRDIKPANLCVCSIGMRLDFVKVLDFGLVRDMAHDLKLTAEHVVSGTPAYMAPESAAHHRYDARSDLYALGCVAYWLLTGRTLFERATQAAEMAAHMYEPVVPPSQFSELKIPGELEAIVMTCLAKDPDARPQSAAELQERLEALPPTWTQQRAEAWWRANAPDILAKSRSGVR